MKSNNSTCDKWARDMVSYYMHFNELSTAGLTFKPIQPYTSEKRGETCRPFTRDSLTCRVFNIKYMASVLYSYIPCPQLTFTFLWHGGMVHLWEKVTIFLSLCLFALDCISSCLVDKGICCHLAIRPQVRCCPKLWPQHRDTALQAIQDWQGKDRLCRGII